MRRILSITIGLLISASAFATVTINVTQGSCGGGNVNKVYVDYATTGEAVRAFALEFTLGTSTPQPYWAGIEDFNRGESTRPGGGYGIFPGRFRNQINPADPNWFDQYYIPIAPPNDVDSNGTGIGTNKVICELGTLYKDANAPGTSGRLFTLVVDFNTQASAALTVASNLVRGGVVLEDSTTVIPIINSSPAPLLNPPCSGCTISGRVVGDAPPMTNGIGGLRLTGPGVDVNTDANGYWSAIVNLPYVGTICVTDVNNQWSFSPACFSPGCDTFQNITAHALECLNARDPGYARWKSATWNKPNCWCFRRQCRGDAGGTKVGFWVYASDLNIFKSSYGKTDAVLATVPNGICADLDHIKAGFIVYSGDLNIFKSYFGKSDALVPECNLPPYQTGVKVNKWTN